MPIINANIAETINITENGQYDVAKYTTANVNCSGSGPAYYIEKTLDSTGRLVNSTSVISLDSSVKDLGDGVIQYAYYKNPTVSGAVDFSSLTTISGENAAYYAFHTCPNITSVDLSSLTTVSGLNSCSGMFYGSVGITTIDISALTTVSGSTACRYMFNNCTGLTGAIDLSSLATISGDTCCGNMFAGCTSITSVNLSSLKTVTGSNCCTQMFSGCTSLTELRFPSITTTSFGSNTNQFYNICRNISNITIHFPSNVQSVVQNLSGYSTAFGATNGTVLFDLPATN